MSRLPVLPEILEGQDIPAVVHLIWVGGAMPGWAAHNVEQWNLAVADDGLEVRFWDDEAAAGTLTMRFLRDRDIPAVIAADLLRLELLYLRGGVYMDLDTVPLRSLGEWVGRRKSWLGQHAHFEDDKTEPFNNATMGFVPGHPLPAAIWQYGIRAVNRGLKSAFSVAGPVIFRKFVTTGDYDVDVPRGPFETVRNRHKKVEVSRGGVFTQAELREMFPEAVVVHQSMSSWREPSALDRDRRELLERTHG